MLEENRFLAARDGVDAELIDPDAGTRVPPERRPTRPSKACRPHAQILGCEAELDHVAVLAERPAAERQVLEARGPARLPGLVRSLAEVFTA